MQWEAHANRKGKKYKALRPFRNGFGWPVVKMQQPARGPVLAARFLARDNLCEMNRLGDQGGAGQKTCPAEPRLFRFMLCFYNIAALHRQWAPLGVRLTTMKGVLLVNLGTPASPRPRDVGAYLREFLSDPRVVDVPRWFWLPLLYGLIVPLRSRRSAHAYAQIWTDEGSPLLVISRAIAAALDARLGGDFAVALAMRYGRPAVREVLAELRDRGVTDLCVLPLYPQYSHTTTGSVMDAVEAGLAELAWSPILRTVRDYHCDPGWVAAVADSIRTFGDEHGPAEQLVFSLHGIPQRYVRAGDPYADQCRASVAAIASELGLPEDGWKLTFQSRVGREPWLQPYTDKSLAGMARAGIRHVRVVCPGFAADCLETLEEIAMQNRELFLAEGGERLDYVPALNDSARHIDVLAGVVERRFAAA